MGDSPQHLSDDEKHIGVGHQRDVLPPDPDEHLSAEEKARIVSQTKHQWQTGSILTTAQDKKLLRKLDYKLIPWVRPPCPYIVRMQIADTSSSYASST